MLFDIIKFLGVVCFAGVAIIGAVNQAIPSASSKLEKFILGFMRPKTILGRVISGVFCILLCFAAILFAIDTWRSIHKESSIRTEAKELASALNALAEKLESNKANDSAAHMKSYENYSDKLFPTLESLAASLEKSKKSSGFLEKYRYSTGWFLNSSDHENANVLRRLASEIESRSKD